MDAAATGPAPPPAYLPCRRSRTDLDRRIVALALPAVGAIAAEPLYGLADTAVVGHLGRSPLDALAVATTALSLVGWVFGFLATATTSTVARSVGAGRDGAARRAAGAAYALAASLGLVASGALVALAPLIARGLGGGSTGAATEYLRISAAGVPFLLVGFAGTGHLTGLARTGTTLRVALLANACNLALELVLVFGAHLGLAGSALGTVVAQAIAACAFVSISSRVAGGPPARPGAAELAGLARDGWALTVRTLAVGAVPLALTAVAARLGPDALAGNQIALRVWLALALLLDALAVPGQVYVSAALRDEDRAGAVAVGRRTLGLGVAAGAALAAATALAAWAAPAAFGATAAARAAARGALLVGAAAQPLAAAAFVLDGLVLGLGDYAGLRRSMLVALLAFAPFAGLVLAHHSLGLVFLWAAYAVWLTVRSLLLGRRWRAFALATGTGPATGGRPGIS